MTESNNSRYAAVSRRAALSGALGAAMFAVAACGNNDSSTLGTGAGRASPPTSPTATGASTSSSAATSSGSNAAVSGTPLPASANLEVAFTFAVASVGGMVHNPYVAVWVEDAGGSLVKTVALWHEDNGGQDRWLSEMKAFSSLDAGDAQTVSSATKQPGSYTVQWDGATSSGTRATEGAYRIFVEAAREHGPYQLIQQDINMGSQAAAFPMTPSGELTAASAKYSL